MSICTAVSGLSYSNSIIMNLIQCLEVASRHQSLSETSFCLSGWILKSHTNFLDSKELHLPWHFGLLCWSFLLGGLVMLLTEPEWTRRSRFPYRTVAYALIWVQAPLSFSADYLCMTSDSIVHCLDRLLACPLMALEIVKIFVMYEHVSTSMFVAYCMATCLAVFSFLQSSAAQDVSDGDGFIFWHNCWHTYPLVVSTIQLGECYFKNYCAEDAAEQKISNNKLPPKREEQQPKHKLLSSVLMEQIEATSSSHNHPRGGLRWRPSTARRRNI